MNVTKRATNSKQHTIGYLIGGKWRTRPEAVRLAKQGKLDGVTIRRGGNDNEYIASLPNRGSLYDLDVTIFKTNDVKRGRK